MKKYIRSRRIRYGSVSLVLTVLVVAVVVIFNVILSLLSSRYEWMYVNMNRSYVYEISEDCEKYLDEHVIPRVDEAKKLYGADEKITVMFCNDKEDIEADDSQKYIHDSVYEIKDMFPDYIKIEYLNIWEHPTRAREFGVTGTGDVVCIFGDRYETMNLRDFYIYDSETGEAVAYNGEKIIAACLMRVTQKETPICYFTMNHGETMTDYELMRSLVEAGYTLGFLDLSESEVPEDCELLITYAPKQDFLLNDGVSETSEIEKLDSYMAQGGKYMVFLSSDTFASGKRENLEAFLAKWGIAYSHYANDDGSETVEMIRDTSHSLSVHGYDVLGKPAESGSGSGIIDDGRSVVFANSTHITFADGFVKGSDGSYTKTVDGIKRSAYPLMVTHSSAEVWIDGRSVKRASDEPFVLMAMASQTCANGETAYLVASASSDFANEDAMQSAVLGNGRALAQIYKHLGREQVPVDLVFKSFGSTVIEGLTARNANVITVCIVAIPTVACLAVGVVLLVRRKYS